MNRMPSPPPVAPSPATSAHSKEDEKRAFRRAVLLTIVATVTFLVPVIGLVLAIVLMRSALHLKKFTDQNERPLKTMVPLTFSFVLLLAGVMINITYAVLYGPILLLQFL